MKRFIENIEKQIEFNQGKNIFLDNLEFFQFAEETVKAMSDIDKLNPDSKDYLIDYATEKAIEEFCRVNQYYSFDLEAKNNLLWLAIQDKVEGLKVRPPFDRDYGMRELHIEVPQTNTLLFIGQEIKSQQ